MGFSSRTWVKKWAEDGTYANMPEIVCGSLKKAYGLSNKYAAAKLENQRSKIFPVILWEEEEEK